MAGVDMESIVHTEVGASLYTVKWVQRCYVTDSYCKYLSEALPYRYLCFSPLRRCSYYCLGGADKKKEIV